MNRLLPIAILAGGVATRMRPLTERIPKALLDINGEPFVAWQLRLLKARGIERVVFCVGYLGELIRGQVGDGRSYGLQVEYSFDGPVLLGTGGCLKKALPLLGNNFFVLYGDSYLDCDYAAVQTAFCESQKQALMTVFLNEGQWDKSNVEFASGQIKAYDKRQLTLQMRHIDYGLGLLNHKVFEAVPAGQPVDLEVIYQRQLKQNQLAGHEIKERFYEIGSLAGLEELRHHLKTKR